MGAGTVKLFSYGSRYSQAVQLWEQVQSSCSVMGAGTVKLFSYGSRNSQAVQLWEQPLLNLTTSAEQDQSVRRGPKLRHLFVVCTTKERNASVVLCLSSSSSKSKELGERGSSIMASLPSSSAVRALSLEYRSLQEEPVEGFSVKLLNDDNLFEWEVAIYGPPDTLYQGGYFKAHMRFPMDYPYSPPSVRFLTKVWHPNVYENGDLCISILHPPVDDPQSGELPCERWNPTQNVRTVLLSVISLLNEPNTYSPANVDASVMYRRFKDSKGSDKEYENIIRKQVSLSRKEAENDGVVVPLTQEDYCIKTKVKPETENVDMADFYDDDYDIDDDDEEEYSDDNLYDGDDSGNGES
ncbi:Ubiquitin-conjugating enzyme E2 [Trinorchestia longiramus]|nr:Ubiquitin-conjugating enzyme E2 [Trinorchestia longiramus]